MGMRPPAGWYPDPENPSQNRYWDGRVWTDQTRDLPPNRHTEGAVGATGREKQPRAEVSITRPETNGLAVASLILGLLWLFWLGSLLAVVFGHRAIRQINRSNGKQTGKGLAVAGLTLGWVGIAIFLLWFGLYLFVYVSVLRG